MKTGRLQLVNKMFAFTPLTRGYGLRALLLRWAGVKCAATARIVASARILTSRVYIGDDTFIGHEVLITGSEEADIEIARNVDIGPRVLVLSGTHDVDMTGPRSAGKGIGKSVIISEGVWVGANSTILPGVRIGAKSVIGAGSVVTTSIPEYTISAGSPCRVIKTWDPTSARFKRMEL